MIRPPRPASTICVFRDGPVGAEVLMVRRGETARFMGGAWVFPGGTVEQALADIDAAVDLGPEHISWYHLTLEPNTVFHARPPAGLPDEAVAADIQDAGSVRLTEARATRLSVISIEMSKLGSQ